MFRILNVIWLSHPQWRAHGQREIVYRHKIARVLHFGAFHSLLSSFLFSEGKFLGITSTSDFHIFTLSPQPSYKNIGTYSQTLDLPLPLNVIASGLVCLILAPDSSVLSIFPSLYTVKIRVFSSTP